MWRQSYQIKQLSHIMKRRKSLVFEVDTKKAKFGAQGAEKNRDRDARESSSKERCTYELEGFLV